MDERSQLLIKKFLRTFARRAEIFNLAAGMGWEKVPSQMAKYLANRDDDLRKSSHRSKRLFHLIQRFASPPRYLAAKSMRASGRGGVAYSILHALLKPQCRQLKRILLPPASFAPIWGCHRSRAPKNIGRELPHRMCQKNFIFEV